MSDKTIYDLVKWTHELSGKLMESGGELTPEIEAELELKDVALAQKADAYATVMSRFEIEAAWFKAEAAKLQAVAKAHENAAERLNQRIKEAMVEMKITEIEGDHVRFKISPTKGKLVVDKAKLPRSYFMIKQEEVPDNERIREELTQNLPVSGARIDTTYALKVSVAKGKK